jgi:hypothetical protein
MKSNKPLYKKAMVTAVTSQETGGRIFLKLHLPYYKICTPRKVLNKENNKINLN